MAITYPHGLPACSPAGAMEQEGKGWRSTWTTVFHQKADQLGQLHYKGEYPTYQVGLSSHPR